MTKIAHLPSRLRAFLGSPRFFYATIGLFVVQALWIALSSHYPMAFDEDFHLGIIRLYAHHLSPFWSGQPAGADAFGAVARDPSYLFQWLMSFPYRLLWLFTHSQTAIVIGLRLIDIALFAASLPLYRRLLLRTGASRAVVHACLLVFVLLPVVPLLAAQINYDNLLLPLVAGLLLLTLRIRRQFIQGTWPLRDIVLLLGGGMLTSLVKYAFLPIFAGLLGFLLVSAWRHRPAGALGAALRTSVAAMHRTTRWGLVLLLVVATVLFVERYGINTLRYHTPIPDCGQVLSVRQCSAYGPWVRDYNYNLANGDDGNSKNPVRYSGDWFYGMWLRTFFAVSGPEDSYQTRQPLPVPAIAGIVASALGVVAVLLRGRAVWRRYDGNVLWLFVAVGVLYIGSLWLTEYKAYIYTGEAVAINGRYLLPVAPLLLVIGALSLSALLRRYRRASVVVAVLIVLTLAWGGGAWTYIIRSSDNWYWQNRVVLDANHVVQHVLWPVTPGANRMKFL